MKTNMAQSSIDAYHTLKASGMSESYSRILAYMKPGRIYSRKEVARALDIETSSMAGRCKELIEMGQIEVCGSINCPVSHMTVQAIKLTGQQANLFN
jgi:DNA-binding MarR family transcriptional regulator